MYLQGELNTLSRMMDDHEKVKKSQNNTSDKQVEVLEG